MTDDLPFSYDSPATVNVTTRRCRRHDWALQWLDSEHVWACARCDRRRDETVTRRGKNNRARGNAIERWVCQTLGIQRRGMYGGPDDGGGEADWITVQVKSGGAYPERIDALLRALPSRAGQLRAVVHTDAPGAGAKRRALITLDLYDFADWYGGRDDAG